MKKEEIDGLTYMRQTLEALAQYNEQSLANPSLAYPELPATNAPEIDAFRQKLEAQTLNWVRQGCLVGYGYEKPRNANDLPVRIPDDLWTDIPYWTKSEIASGSLSIEAVRLIPRKWLVESPASRGRPSRKGEIRRAYDALHARREIDFSRLLGAHYQAIRNQVLLANPDDPRGSKGLGDDVIRETLRERFDQDRKKHAA